MECARATYQDDDTIRLHVLDASDLPFPDSSFDVVLLFECIYYLPDPQRALEEAHRVLRPGGCLLIAPVNCEWRGFNPSPFSRQYPAADELQMRLEQCGFAVEMRAGFPESRGILSLLVSSIRRIAVRLRLVPRTMNGKAFLKRIFYGGLQPIPARMSLRPFTIDPLEPVTAATDLTRYRVLYAAARRGAEVSPEI